MKLIFTKLVNLIPLEQCHHKPTRMYADGLLKLALNNQNMDCPIQMYLLFVKFAKVLLDLYFVENEQ